MEKLVLAGEFVLQKGFFSFFSFSICCFAHPYASIKSILSTLASCGDLVARLGSCWNNWVIVLHSRLKFVLRNETKLEHAMDVNDHASKVKG
jgi:hypothetical protein